MLHFRLHRHWLLVASLVPLWSACTTTPKPREVLTYAPRYHDTAVAWYGGPEDELLRHAALEDRPIFIFWAHGDDPETDRIAKRIFSRPESGDLLTTVTAVWSGPRTLLRSRLREKYGLTEQPAMLLVTSEGAEIMRFDPDLSWDEFRQAFSTAITAGEPFAATLERALAGYATPSDWTILAFSDRRGSELLGQNPVETLRIRKQLADLAPAERQVVKARLVTLLLETYLEKHPREVRENPEFQRLVGQIRRHAEHYLASLFLSQATLETSRRLLVDRGDAMIRMLFPHAAERGDSYREQIANARLRLAPETTTR